MLWQKQQRMDTVITRQQRTLLIRHEGALRLQQATALTAVQQRHEREMNAIPHQQLIRSTIAIDT